MRELQEALSTRAQELARGRVPFVRATVVRAQSPTSSHPGDTALVHADGEIEGFVGGTCAEASVREYSLRALATNEPLLLRIVPGEPSSEYEEGAITVANPCLSGGAMEIFLEPQNPLPRVLVVGATPIAQAFAALGGPLDIDVELTDGASAAPRPDDAALIVASHGRDEELALTAALRAEVPYVALVASKKRGAAVLASLDVDDDQRARVHSPAGLSIGARTPGEIALSILAELISERVSEKPAVLVAVPATATDPVCGMSVSAVAATTHVEHGGRTVYFCCENCRASFVADPERYAVAS
jgi:xanthine dehydrogenase accessory factor